MGFASFFSGGFITAIVVNPPERRLAKHISVQWVDGLDLEHSKIERIFAKKILETSDA